jgi:ankyrin repeat protein
VDGFVGDKYSPYTLEELKEKIKDPAFNVHQRVTPVGCSAPLSLLHAAVLDDNLELVKFLLKIRLPMVIYPLQNALLGEFHPSERYAIYPENALTYVKSLRMAKLLLEYGADVNQGSWWDEQTLLIQASHNGDLDMVKLCLKYGADVNFATKGWYCEGIQSFTALEAACRGMAEKSQCVVEYRHKHPEFFKIIKILVENGAKINREH